MKYNEQIKQKAVELAVSGVSLKEIQSTVGPNPKATMRYLVKAGIDYSKIREQLKEAGKLQPAVKKQNTKKTA